MKHVLNGFVGTMRSIIRLLGLSAIGTLIIAGVVALRHTLETPQPLESILPGEAHLYRWKHGHIFYKVAGKPGAPPLVLLHTPDLAASAYEMRGIMTLLAAHFRVYAPDLLGFGLSDRPDIDYSADLYTQLCRDFLAQVVRQPATIVASRLSCNYAVVVATTSPDLCERLALISPTALFGEQPEEARYARILPAALLEAGPVKSLLYPFLVEIMHLAGRFQPLFIRSTYANKDGGSTFRPPTYEDEDAINRVPTARQGFDYVYATTHQFGAEHASMALLAGKLVSDVSREIEKVQQPTLIIWGAEDLERTRHMGMQPDQRNTFWGAKQTQMALLQDAGQAVHEQLPEIVVETLLQWSEGIVSQALPTTSMSESADTGAGSEFRLPNNQTDSVPASGSGSLGSRKSMINRAPTVSQAALEPSASAETENSASQIEAYCMKCKKKTVMLNAHEITMKNGRLAVQGVCAECGASLIRMGRLVGGYPQTPV